MRKRERIPAMICLLLGLLLVSACGGIRGPGGPSPGSKASDPAGSQPSQEESPPADWERVTPRDAEAYLETNSRILSVRSAKDSQTVFTEKDIQESLDERGLGDYPITWNYSMEGQFSEETGVKDSSPAKHPTYSTFYISEDDEYWTIFVVDGFVMAIPVTYNLLSERTAQVILSESDTIMSYDSVSNRFFETLPDGSQLMVKKVDRIDAETLEKLTREAIDDL